MLITVCLAVWNEENSVAESIRSTKAYADRFVVIDSAFLTNPAPGTHSTDRTREVCERVCHPVPLTYIESPVRLAEQEARNLYMDEVAEGDWVFVIDGDEVLYGDHKVMVKFFNRVRSGKMTTAVTIPVYTTAVLFNGSAMDMDADTYVTAPTVNSRGWQPRLFANRPALRYRVNAYGVPHGVYDGDGVFVGRGAIRANALFIVNHHVRQAHASYQNDYVWETEARKIGP